MKTFFRYRFPPEAVLQLTELVKYDLEKSTRWGNPLSPLEQCKTSKIHKKTKSTYLLQVVMFLHFTNHFSCQHLP